MEWDHTYCGEEVPGRTGTSRARLAFMALRKGDIGFAELLTWLAWVAGFGLKAAEDHLPSGVFKDLAHTSISAPIACDFAHLHLAAVRHKLREEVIGACWDGCNHQKQMILITF